MCDDAGSRGQAVVLSLRRVTPPRIRGSALYLFKRLECRKEDVVHEP